MADSPVRVVARIVAKPDKVDELREVLARLIEPTHAEPGCIQYEMLQNNADPTDFTFVEHWESDASLDAHLASEHLQAALADLPQLISGEPDIRRYHVAR